MKRSALQLLSCPDCKGPVSLSDERSGGTVTTGELCCPRCERVFPIDNGIPRFIDPEALEGPNRRFARFYDWFSRFYPFLTRLAMSGFGGERKARKEVLDRLELTGGRVLEVSIGTGANLPFLFEPPGVDEVFGLDISYQQLARCSSSVAKKGWPVDLLLGRAEALPFRAESFDGVLHIGGINFFSGKKQAIDEMIRVARPGSKIVIADESEKLARLISRIPGLSPRPGDGEVDLAVPVHLVPDSMEEIRVHGIWKAHGEHHGYCLEFRKPK